MKYNSKIFIYSIIAALGLVFATSDTQITKAVDTSSISSSANEEGVGKVSVNSLEIKEDINSKTLVKDKLTFIIQNQYRPEDRLEVTSVEGKLPKFSVYTDEIYTVSLKENSNFTMNSRQIYSFMNGFPVDYDDDENGHLIETLVVNKKEKKVSVYLPVVDPTEKEDGFDKAVTDELKFTLTKANGEKVELANDEGEIYLKKLSVGEYTLELQANSKWKLAKVNLKVEEQDGNFALINSKNNERYLSVKLSKDSALVPSDNEETKKYPDECEPCGSAERLNTGIFKVVDASGNVVNKELNFRVFNNSNSKLLGNFTAKDGELASLSLIKNDYYVVELLDDEYKMEDRYMYIYSNASPINTYTELVDRVLTVVKKTSKDEDTTPLELRKYPLALDVMYEGKKVLEPVHFKLYGSDGDIIDVISKDGVFKTDLKCDDKTEYTVFVESDKYTIESFPLVLKRKPYGIHPFDHSDCNIVRELKLLNKDSEIANHVINNSYDGKQTPVSVNAKFNFRDLELHADAISNPNIEKLKGKEIQALSIWLKNTYRDEESSVTNIDFTVTVRKDLLKNVSNVYYLDNNGNLEEREIVSQSDTTVTFKTTHFSTYVLVYGGDKEKINEIAPEKVLEELKAGSLVVDVRSKEEYDFGHIDGAINIPVSSIENTIQNYANKDKKIILYCNTGRKSAKAYNILSKLGYTNIYNTKGVTEYHYDLVKTEVPKEEKPEISNKENDLTKPEVPSLDKEFIDKSKDKEQIKSEKVKVKKLAKTGIETTSSSIGIGLFILLGLILVSRRVNK